ncbi:hypothetical protein [Deinococcus rufus]|uniref:Uncharacterized protein n=1 Tax=Deinococcus rufus TaxID=2136097 RepID=A0ABV7ZAS6_9DEIO
MSAPAPTPTAAHDAANRALIELLRAHLRTATPAPGDRPGPAPQASQSRP